MALIYYLTAGNNKILNEKINFVLTVTFQNYLSYGFVGRATYLDASQSSKCPKEKLPALIGREFILCPPTASVPADLYNSVKFIFKQRQPFHKVSCIIK